MAKGQKGQKGQKAGNAAKPAAISALALSNAAHVVALGRAVPEATGAKAREVLKPGTYEVDFLARFRGFVVVGEDYERAPTTSLPVLEIMAAFFSRIKTEKGIDDAKAMLVGALHDVIAETGKGEGAFYEEDKKAIASAMEDVKDVVKALPKVPVKGSVRANLSVEEVVAQAAPEHGGVGDAAKEEGAPAAATA